MLKNYIKIAIRNLLKNRIYSIINITGLAVGIAVTILIGLWIWDELNFNKWHQNYDDLAIISQNQTINGEVNTGEAIPRPLEFELRNTYGNQFQYISMASWNSTRILSFKNKNIYSDGRAVQKDFPEMLSLKMIEGTKNGLQNPNNILLSASVATSLFGKDSALEKIIKLDNEHSVKVIGVYEDIPFESDFREEKYLMSWNLYKQTEEWVKEAKDEWHNNSFPLFVQIKSQGNMEEVSQNILKAKLNKVGDDLKKYNYEIFLHPMSKWHLYSNYENGKNAGGRIKYVWLFSLIGFFVLLLACVNFMNLSTARSERRAKEVGIRKVMGSVKTQLIGQFLSESFLVTGISFVIALFLVELTLPFFNDIAGKEISMLWFNPYFWLISLGFIILTGFVAGSYPAFYLSSFQPVKVLKGTFQVGKYASLPRKVLVVLQFTVSITLIIGTVIVFNQILHSKNRPIGYDQNGLVSIFISSDNFRKKLPVLARELKASNAIVETATSFSPMTGIWSNQNGFEWQGKNPDLVGEFAVVGVGHNYGKTIGWELVAGREFSKEFATDSNAILLNEKAVEFMGVEDPIGMQVIQEDIEDPKNNKKYHVIGVVKDMLMQSPYQPIRHTIYRMDFSNIYWIHLKLNPNKSSHEALAQIESIFNKIIPDVPFDYHFVDEKYARKFLGEERLGKLASFFAGLAIFISCLGLFGLASFMAEKRSKEVGIRKILGASLLALWKMLSKEFLVLTFISFIVASPIAYYFLEDWLQNYEYRTPISWWIFEIVGLGAILITLLTVSYQSIKVAMLNPVDVLKDE